MLNFKTEVMEKGKFMILSIISNPGGDPTIMGAYLLAKLPWNIVLIFGGGFALAREFRSSNCQNS